MSLTSFQKRYLRGLAHALSPVVMLGQKGVTASVRSELQQAIEHHELLKVRLSGGDREARASQLAELTADSDIEVVQIVGHTATLWQRNEKAPRLPLPK